IEPVGILRLRRHPEGASQQIEVVDIGGAEIGLQRAEHVGHVDAEHLCLGAVDIEVDLGGRVFEQREDLPQAGRLRGAIHHADTAARRASGPRPLRSATIMRKPPAVPMPRTGGGAMTRTSPSWITDSFCRRGAWSAGPDFRGSFARFSNGSRATKTVPELGALVKVAPEKPTKLTAWVIPGT